MDESTNLVKEMGENWTPRCPNCGEYLDEEGYDPTFEDGRFTKYDCSACGEVTYDESIASRAERVVAGEVEPEDVFPWYEAHEERVRDELEMLERPDLFTVEFEPGMFACQHEGCGLTRKDFGEGARMFNLKDGRYLCPKHGKAAVAEGAERKYPLTEAEREWSDQKK
ncbi:hypothetical protein [Haladaptatus sp. ZSTT2]|uniref:hypothetical protein n=1 Tax=Haladaptatus sp. ZSTT2 TaxID=3120515 RepID=UPI00300E72F1